MRFSATSRVALVCFLVLFLPLNSSVAGAGHPPQERRRNQNVESAGERVFGSGSFGLEVVWKKSLGSGNSRITVADGRVITMFSDGEFDNLVALDAATGEEIWRYRIAMTYGGHDGSADGPHATPIVDEGVVYGLGPKGHLFAVSLTEGKEIWSKKIDEELGARAPFWGFATNPIVEGEVLIVQTGSTDGRSITGFNKKTGELLWSVGDDRVGYQSPAVMMLAGQRQVVTVTNKEMMGIEPRTGEVLWTHQHSTTELDGSSQPVFIGEDKFILTSSNTEYTSDVALYQVKKTEDGFAVEEAWRASVLNFSLTVPVRYEDHLYGFKGSFLTCVDLATGKTVWKSRPPGRGDFVLVGGHLVIIAQGGLAVVVEATPEGYREKARLQVLDRGSLSAPSFAGGRIFVRNHTQIASIEVTERVEVTTAATEEPEPAFAESDFGAFVRRAKAAEDEDKDALIDAFMASQERFPIIEGDSLAHFVYRGATTDVGIHGTMTDRQTTEPMSRIPGTDFYYRSYTFEPNSRWEYRFMVDFGRLAADPLNPRTAPGEWEDSELVMPGWDPPEHLRDPTGEQGRIESFEFASEILGNRRDVKVYLPAGYSESDDRYPLLIVNDGLLALEYGQMDRSLNNLIGSSVVPLIVAFVGPPKAPPETWQEAGGPPAYQEYGGARTEQHARMLARELVPDLDRRYRTHARPDTRAIMGNGRPGLAALYAAVHHPDVLGKVAVQSPWLHRAVGQSSRFRRRTVRDAVVAVLEGEKELPLQFYLDWASHDSRSAELGMDLREASRELTELLQAKGYSVAGGEYAGGDGWGSWRARTDEILEAFFPLPEKNVRRH